MQKHGSRFVLTQNAVSINQRSPVGFSAWLDDGARHYLKQIRGLETTKMKHTVVGFVLRTNAIHYDNDAVGARVWTSGPGFGSIQSQRVHLKVSHSNGEMTVLDCGNVVSVQGKDCITSLGKANWFSSASDVTVTVRAVLTGTQYQSSTSELRLVKKRRSVGLETVGVYMSLPSFPVIAGDEFTADVYVNTYARDVRPNDYFALQVARFTITYDANFTLKQSHSTLYTTGTPTSKTSAQNTTTEWILTQKGTDDSAVMGDKVLLATLTFKVSATAPAQTSNNPPFSVMIVGFSTTAGLKVVSNQAGSVYDYNGDSLSATGHMQIASATDVGLLAYVQDDEQELINLASIGLTSPTSKIAVRAVRSCHTSANLACFESALGNANDFKCQSLNTNVMNNVGASTCTVAFTGKETTGGDVTVRVIPSSSSSSVSATDVPFRVWLPQDLRLVASDIVLNKIARADGSVVMDPRGNCAAPLYQSSRLTLSAVLTLVSTGNGKLMNSSRVDLTHLFAFEVIGGDSKAVVLSDTGAIVRGVKPAASVTVGCKGSDACGGQSVEFVVSDSVESITELRASVLNTLSVENTFNSGTSTTSFKITVVAENILESEGDTAQVFASLKMSDGSYAPMTEMDLKVTSSVLSVVGRTKVQVPVGAPKMEGCDLLKVVYWSCGVEIARASPYVLVDMPAVKEVKLIVIGSAVIVFSTDPLAAAPAMMPTATELKAIVIFGNDQSKDFSADERAVFSLDNADLAVLFNKHFIRTPTLAANAESRSGEVKITVELGSYAPGISGTTTVRVDKFESLALSAHAFPVCNTAGCGVKSILNRLPNGGGDARKGTAVFQRVQLSLTATSKFGTQFNIGLGQSVEAAISDRSVLNVHGNSVACPAMSSDASSQRCVLKNSELHTTPLAGMSAGKANVTATWQKHLAVIGLQVHDKVTFATKVRLELAQGSTVAGLIDSMHSLQITTEFDDGTSFRSDAVSSWVPVETYLKFVSTNSDVLAMRTDGVMILKGNSPGAGMIAVTVAARAGTANRHTQEVYANLIAGDWDLDIESGDFDRGSQFPVVQGGQTFGVKVIINSAQTILTGFQFVVQFDPDVLRVSNGDVSRGDQWLSGDFTVTTGSPASQVYFVGENSGSTVRGRVEVARIQFTVQKERPFGKNKSPVSGLIELTLGPQGLVAGTPDRRVVAGKGEAWAQVRRRRQLLPAPGDIDPAYSMVVPARRSLSTGFDLFPNSAGMTLPAKAHRGDINADGNFNVQDLSFLKRFMQGDSVAFAEYKAFQQQEMDPDFSGGQPDVNDVGFILNALAMKKRFLVSPPSITVTNCSVEVKAMFVDKHSEPLREEAAHKNKVLLELKIDGSVVDSEQEIITASLSKTPSDAEGGVVVVMSGPVEGAFTAKLQIVATTVIEVALLTYTYEDDGVTTSSSRRTPWKGSAYAEFGADGFSFKSISTHKILHTECVEEDCEGTPGGDAVFDSCGVCGGDNSTCSGNFVETGPSYGMINTIIIYVLCVTASVTVALMILALYLGRKGSEKVGILEKRSYIV